MAFEKMEPITNSIEIKPPEAWLTNEDIKKSLDIDPNHIISFTGEGNPLSFYKDDVWDLTPYNGGSVRKNKIFFDKIKSINDKALSKRLVFVMLMFTKGRGGLMKSAATLNTFYGRALFDMHKYAYKRTLHIKQILENKDFLNDYIKFLEEGRTYIIVQLFTLMMLLKNSSENLTGVKYEYDEELEEKASRLRKNVSDGFNQTECIPVSILLESTSQRWQYIDEAIINLPKVLKLIDLLLLDPDNYRTVTSREAQKTRKAGRVYITFRDAMYSMGLGELFGAHGIVARDKLGHYLSRLQNTSKYLIHTFTGMRHDEANRLLTGCYSDTGASNHPTITSTEKKGSKVLVKHAFVTIREIKKVIELNEKITNTIAKFKFPDLDDLPLMINTKWLSSDKEGPKVKHIANYGYGLEIPLNSDGIRITDEHIEKVLKVVDPYRDWDHDEKYKVGMLWTFTYHQYRRSMAVYGLGSGLVSSSALGRQFKHFFNSTTAHYGNGSFVASPIDGTDDKNHIKQFLNEERYELDALALQRDLLFNIRKLKGPKSSFTPDKNTVQSIEPDDIVINKEDLKTIGKRLKSGAQFYKSTALGSCASIEPCNGHLMLLYFGCIGCTHSDIDDEKLIDTIEGHSEFEKFLDERMPNSIEARTNKIELEEMLEHQKKLLGETDE